MPRDTDDQRFWDRVAHKYSRDPIKDMVGYTRTLESTRHRLRETDTVLEFGCGTGTTALSLAQSVARLVGTDASSEMITIAREKADAQGCDAAVKRDVRHQQQAPGIQDRFGRDGQVAAVFQRVRVEHEGLAVDLAAAHAVAQHEHGRGAADDHDRGAAAL